MGMQGGTVNPLESSRLVEDAARGKDALYMDETEGGPPSPDLDRGSMRAGTSDDEAPPEEGKDAMPPNRVMIVNGEARPETIRVTVNSEVVFSVDKEELGMVEYELELIRG